MKLSLPPNTQDRMKLSLPPNTQDRMKLSLPPNTQDRMKLRLPNIWVFGPLTKNSHIQDGLLTISQAPIINIKTGIVVEGWGRLPPNNRRLEQICVPPFLFPSGWIGVLLINKT
jgi:hypothetical protein